MPPGNVISILWWCVIILGAWGLSTRRSAQSELGASSRWVPRLDRYIFDRIPKSEIVIGIFQKFGTSNFPNYDFSKLVLFRWFKNTVLGTQCVLSPSSARAERRVDGPHPPRSMIHPHSIIVLVSGGDPEASEHHLASKRFLVFFCSRVSAHWNHLTDFSELVL